MSDSKESHSRDDNTYRPDEIHLPGDEPSLKTRRGLIRLIAAISRPFLVRGVRLPWSTWVLGNMSASEQAWIGRMKIAYEIQTADYRLKFGPLWLRRLFDSLSVRLIQSRFWLVASWKISISFILLATPFALFLLYRAFLPFPDAILKGHRVGALDAVGTVSRGWRVSSPYRLASVSDQLGRSFLSEATQQDLEALKFGPILAHMGEDFGLQPVKITDDEQATSEIRAAVVLQEGQKHRFVLGEKISGEVAGENIVTGSFVVLSRSGLPVRCRLEIKDDTGSVLVSTEKSARQRGSLAGTFSAFTRSLFKGNSLLVGPGAWESFSVSRSVLPSELSVSISQIHPAGVAALSAEEATGLNSGDCMCAFSGPHALTRKITPLLPHALLLVLIDGGSERLSRDADLMPNLNELAQLGIRWRRYFNHHVSADRNFHQLMIGDLKSTEGQIETSLFSVARKNGYQTLHFGEWDDLVDRGFSTHLFPGSVWQVEVPFYKGLGAALELRNWIAGRLNEPFFAVIRLSDVQNRLIPPWKFLQIDQFLMAPLGVSGKMSRYEAMLRYMDAALGQVIETAQLLSRSAVVDVVVTSPSGFQFESRYHPLSEGLLPTKGATFKTRGPLTPDLVHAPLLYARLGADDLTEATRGHAAGSEIFQLSSTSEAHRLLSEILSGRSLNSEIGGFGDEDAQYPHRQTAATKSHEGQRKLSIYDSGQMGLLAELPQSRQIVFWSQSAAEPDEQINTSSFPYRHTLGKDPTERAFLYDPESGSAVPPPANQGLSPYALKESFRQLMSRTHEPALTLRGKGPVEIVLKGLEAIEHQGPASSLPVKAYGGYSDWNLRAGSTELRYSAERGAPYLLTLGQSLFRPDTDVRVELSGGSFQVCGQALPSAARSVWLASGVRSFLEDPPHCSLLPVRVPARESESGLLPQPRPSGRTGEPVVVEVLAGWSLTDVTEDQRCEEESCLQRLP